MSNFKVGQFWRTIGNCYVQIVTIGDSVMLVRDTTVKDRHYDVDLTGAYNRMALNSSSLCEQIPSIPMAGLPVAPPAPIGWTPPLPKPRDLTLREFQTSLPWTIRYSTDFRSSPMTHKDFAHTLHHISKAAGKLHALADDMDHDRAIADDPASREQHAKYIADLVVCALRLANTFPGGVVDLQAAVHARIEDKNGVKL